MASNWNAYIQKISVSYSGRDLLKYVMCKRRVRRERFYLHYCENLVIYFHFNDIYIKVLFTSNTLLKFPIVFKERIYRYYFSYCLLVTATKKNKF